MTAIQEFIMWLDTQGNQDELRKLAMNWPDKDFDKKWANLVLSLIEGITDKVRFLAEKEKKTVRELVQKYYNLKIAIKEKAKPFMTQEEQDQIAQHGDDAMWYLSAIPSKASTTKPPCKVDPSFLCDNLTAKEPVKLFKLIDEMTDAEYLCMTDMKWVADRIREFAEDNTPS